MTRSNTGNGAEPIITARVADFCRMSGISKRQVYRMIKAGELQSVKFGTIRLINVEAYRRRVSE